MGFNKRRMEMDRKGAAEKEAMARRELGPQVLEDAARLVETCNARQEARMPMLFSPTIGAAIVARQFNSPRSAATAAQAAQPTRRTHFAGLRKAHAFGHPL
jgi:hypothetical protein